MPEKSLDLGLLEMAIEVAGSVAALARRMGVKENTPYEWLRRLREGGRLSKDKRRRLQAIMDGGSLVGAPDQPPDHLASLRNDPDLLRHVERQIALLAKIPALQREVDELRDQLARIEAQVTLADETARAERVQRSHGRQGKRAL